MENIMPLTRVHSDSFLLKVKEVKDTAGVMLRMPYSICRCRRYLLRTFLGMAAGLFLLIYWIVPYTLAFSGFIHIDHQPHIKAAGEQLKVYRSNVDSFLKGLVGPDSYQGNNNNNNSTSHHGNSSFGNHGNNTQPKLNQKWSGKEFIHEKFRALEEAVQKLQNMVKKNPPPVVTPVNYHFEPIEAVCAEYAREPGYKRPKVTQIWRSENSYPSNGITLVTQMSLDRLPFFARTLTHWDGPVSAAIYVNQSALSNITTVVKQYHVLLERNNLELHLVYKVGVLWPVNFLRNVALDNSPTDLVFLTDVDFVPCWGLHKRLQTYSRGMPTRSRVYVIPAFEFIEDPGTFYPRNKSELIQHWKGTIEPHHKIQPFDWEFYPPSHLPTNFRVWEHTQAIYHVGYERQYEPYILTNRHHIPRYNEWFVGRIQDKISHLYEIYKSGFEFYVLPDVFLLHYPHPNKKYVAYRNCGMKMFYRFKDIIRQKYKGVKHIF